MLSFLCHLLIYTLGLSLSLAGTSLGFGQWLGFTPETLVLQLLIQPGILAITLLSFNYLWGAFGQLPEKTRTLWRKIVRTQESYQLPTVIRLHVYSSLFSLALVLLLA